MKWNLIIIILLSIAFNMTKAQEVEYTPQVADTYYLKAINEFNKHNYKSAKLHFDLSWEINDSIQRIEPYLSSNAPNWLAHILYMEGDKEEAQEISVDYCFPPVDQRNTYQSDSLWILASECQDLQQSLDFSKKARSLEIITLGHKHYYIANSDQQIASIYMQLEQWDSSKYYQEEAIDIYEEWIKNDYTQLYITTLLEHIRTNVQLYDLDAYKKSVTKCKTAAQKLFGCKSESYAYTLYNIAWANSDVADFVDCISNAKEAANIYSQLSPSSDIEMHIAMCYQLLGNAFGHINNYHEAKTYLQQANDILDKNKIIGDLILFDIAYYQGRCGEYYNAITTYKKLINIINDAYSQYQHNNSIKQAQRLLISSHLDIAEIYYDQKEIDSTILYASNGLSLAKQYDFPNKQLEALQTLSVCYFEQSLYDKAIELQEYILNIDSNNMKNMYNLMWSYYAAKNGSGFYKCARQYYAFERNSIITMLSKIYETNRSEYLENGDFNHFKCPIRFARYYSNDDSICCLAYNNELFRKGLLLTSSIGFSRMISECDEGIQINYQKLKKIRERLNHKTSDQERSELVEEEQQLESLLLKQIPRWAENINQLQYTWKDIQNSLKYNEIAVEFAEDIISSKNKMVALIIRRGWETPKCVVLDEFDCNEERVRNYDFSVFSDKSLSNSIWEEIITEAQISDHEIVYFAADGVFRVFPIEYLPDPDNMEQTISDRFDMVRLSSTREICSQNKGESFQSISLYGNLLYDITVEQKFANSRIYTPSQFCAIDNAQSAFLDGAIRAGYKQLHWTKAEIDSIEQFAINYSPQIQVFKFELDRGTEESFKELSKNNTSIIHLATHAFYYESSNHKDSFHSEGLLFSGCNTKCDDSLNVEDGILCSSEIELLDLRNTSLLVLSACNTGLGKTMVDGIGGLQRAFKKAGVGTIVMSLWEVSDIATSYFMQQFYKSLFITNSKREAFVFARQQTKDKFEDPYYWASFIMLD